MSISFPYEGGVNRYRDHVQQGLRRFRTAYEAFGNSMPAKKIKYGAKTKTGRSTSYVKRKRNKKSRHGRRRRYKLVGTGFPRTKLVHMQSIHLVDLNPGSAAQTAFIAINANNPLDPINNAESQNLTMETTEHHPAYWDVYESVYNRFEVISIKVTVTHLSNNVSDNLGYFMVASPTKENDEIKVICQDVTKFATRLREAFPKRANVFFTASSSGSNSEKVIMKRSANIRKLEGITDAHDNVLIGLTSRSDTQSAPTRSPLIYAGLGALRASTDINQTETIVKIEYMVLFTDRARKEGVAA